MDKLILASDGHVWIETHNLSEWDGDRYKCLTNSARAILFTKENIEQAYGIDAVYKKIEDEK